MAKWSNMTLGEKFFQAACCITGYAMGSFVGGALSQEIKEAGRSAVLADTVGAAAMIAYTGIMSEAGNAAIELHRERKRLKQKTQEFKKALQDAKPAEAEKTEKTEG